MCSSAPEIELRKSEEIGCPRNVVPILVTSFSFGYLICFQLKIHQSAEELPLEAFRFARIISY